MYLCIRCDNDVLLLIAFNSFEVNLLEALSVRTRNIIRDVRFRIIK